MLLFLAKYNFVFIILVLLFSLCPLVSVCVFDDFKLPTWKSVNGSLNEIEQKHTEKKRFCFVIFFIISIVRIVQIHTYFGLLLLFIFQFQLFAIIFRTVCLSVRSHKMVTFGERKKQQQQQQPQNNIIIIVFIGQINNKRIIYMPNICVIGTQKEKQHSKSE